ncbi:response regulator [Microvirga flocculans]|nr:response regulator [Microvirga flocculans]
MSEGVSESRMTVLVVEDQILVRIFAADFLEDAGFKVFEAAKADEALTALQARPDIQAIVTDVEMPGSMNGFELARAVHEQWPGVQVIVTSGRKHPGLEELPDAIPFLAKPYMPETVVNLIRQMATPQVVEAPASVGFA